MHSPAAPPAATPRRQAAIDLVQDKLDEALAQLECLLNPRDGLARDPEHIAAFEREISGLRRRRDCLLRGLDPSADLPPLDVADLVGGVDFSAGLVHIFLVFPRT